MAERYTKPKGSNYIFLVGLIIGLIVIVIIALQNSTTVTLKILTWQFENSLSLFLTLLFILGFIIGLFTSLINLFRKDRTISRQTKLIQKLEREIDETHKERKEADDDFLDTRMDD